MKHTTRLRIGPVTFDIGSDWAAPISALNQLYAPYPKPPSDCAEMTVRLEASNFLRRHIRPQLHIRGDYTIPDALPLPLDQGLLAAEMAMNLQVALGWRRHMLLHASAVEHDGAAVLMSGASGSGKSTLAAMLGEQDGWRLFGDEFSLIAPETGDAWPFPRPISLKNAAIDVMAAMVPAVPADRFGPRLIGTPKGDICHLVPRANALAAMDQPAPPRLLLFPRFGGATSVQPMLPSEAFVRLTEASTNYVALGEAGFVALTRLVQAVPAYAISYDSGAAGMALVHDLLAQAVIA
jgi:HprK-related kinase A